MGVFDIEIVRPTRARCSQSSGTRARARNVLAWRAHDRIFPKMLAFDGVSTGFHLGFAGPMFRSELEDAPNADEGDFALDRRIAIGDLFNEAGLPASDMREMEGYERQVVEWSLARDKHGAIIDTGWHVFAAQSDWAPHPTPAPDDWDIEHPTEPYRAPYGWTDCYPWEPVQGYPYCHPNIWYGWWEDYDDHCIDPSNYGGSCPANDAESGLASCPSCNDFGIMQLSGFPVGMAFVTITREGEDEELLAAATFNGPTWWRRGGTLRVRYKGRMG